MNVVFGICERPDPGYGFFHVFCEKKPDGQFARVLDAVKSYPSKGAIWVGGDHAGGCPFEYGLYGVFEIGDAAHGNSSRYMATRTLNEARQIVSAPYRSTDFEAVRKQLQVGVETQRQLGPKSQILLRFEDGVIAGPFDIKNRYEDNIYTGYCEDLTLQQVKRAWKSLPVQTVKWNGATLTFHFGALPAAEFFLDYAPSEFSLKAALDHFVAQRKMEGILSVRKTRELANQLADVVVPEELRCRTSRLISTLQTISISAEELEILLQGLREHPTVKERLETEVEQAKAGALAHIQSDLAKMKNLAETERKAVAKLSEHKAELDRAVGSAQAALTELKERHASATVELTKAFDGEIAKSMANVHDTLAKVAVLKQFMGTSSPAPTEPKESGFCVTVRSDAIELRSVAEAVKHLSANLVAIGLHAAHAKDVAIVVTTSLCRGGAVSFRGSMSRRIAETVAISCLGSEWTRVSVPVGLAEDAEVGTPRRVLFVGANRSCPDAYAAHVVDACRPGAAKGTYALFDLSEAASALPPGMIFSEIGPVVHTDALLWTGKVTHEIKPAALNLDPIVEVREDGEFKGRLDPLFSKDGNACVRLLLFQQMRILPVVLKTSAPSPMPEDAASKEAERLLVTWWLIPYLSARRARREFVVDLADAHRNEATVIKNIALHFADPEPL
jgi:hypothetical protein